MVPCFDMEQNNKLFKCKQQQTYTVMEPHMGYALEE